MTKKAEEYKKYCAEGGHWFMSRKRYATVCPLHRRKRKGEGKNFVPIARQIEHIKRLKLIL